MCRNSATAQQKKIAEKGYNLVPSRYIEFENRDETLDFDTTMKNLQSELADLLNQEKKLALLSVFKNLGYEINLQGMIMENENKDDIEFTRQNNSHGK